MKHDLRISTLKATAHYSLITDIAQATVHTVAEFEQFKQIGLCRRRQCQAEHLCAHALQPKAEPGTFKARVPAHPHPLALPERRIDESFVQTHCFQGA